MEIIQPIKPEDIERLENIKNSITVPKKVVTDFLSFIFNSSLKDSFNYISGYYVYLSEKEKVKEQEIIWKNDLNYLINEVSEVANRYEIDITKIHTKLSTVDKGFFIPLNQITDSDQYFLELLKQVGQCSLYRLLNARHSVMSAWGLKVIQETIGGYKSLDNFLGELIFTLLASSNIPKAEWNKLNKAYIKTWLSQKPIYDLLNFIVIEKDFNIPLTSEEFLAFRYCNVQYGMYRAERYEEDDEFGILPRYMELIFRVLKYIWQRPEDKGKNIGNRAIIISSKPEIIICGKKIHIGGNTIQSSVAKVLFKNLENLKREWEFIDIAEEIEGDHFIGDKEETIKIRKKYHQATIRIRAKIASEAQIKDFFSTTNKTVQLNPKIIEKIEFKN